MNPQQRVRLSKLLSLILRHQPQRFGVTLDAEGYAALEEVLHAVRTRFPQITITDIYDVVSCIEPDKQRLSILGGEIRANYGHSLPGHIEQAVAEPPDVLLHGTSRAALADILAHGLQPMRRQYVHMTTERALAERIGARHGTACVLTVAAARAAVEGVNFYRANSSFWLAKAVPARYLAETPPRCGL